MGLIHRFAAAAARTLGPESRLVTAGRPLYDLALTVAHHRRGLSRELNGEDFRVLPAHRHNFAPHYDAPVVAHLRQRVAPGALCFNVGANVGVYVLQMARWSAPDGRIVAFEPNPVAAEILERHVRLNGFVQRVDIVRAAVGARGGVGILHASAASGMSRLGAANPLIAHATRRIPVPVVSLDDYCRTTGADPDLVFMDVEGAEVDVLDGARELIARARPRLLLVAEFHPNAWSRPMATVLEALGLRPIPLTGQRRPLEEHGVVLLEPRS